MIQKSGTGDNNFAKWKGTFRSDRPKWPDRSEWTNFKAGPEYTGRTKPKWSVSFDFTNRNFRNGKRPPIPKALGLDSGFSQIRESRITLHGAKEPSNTIHYPSLGMLMKGSKSNHIPGAHNPELATPMLGLCHGVFTDQFIFRHIVGHFFGENRTSTMSMSAFEVWRIKKENQMLLKGKNIIFRSVGFCWLVCGI